MNAYGYVYLTTNLVTQHVYVGQHVGAFDPGYIGSGVVLGRAVKKYGRQQFSVELLETAEAPVALDLCEMDYIAVFRSMGAEMYNLAIGGKTHGSGIFHHNYRREVSATARENMAQAKKGTKRSAEACRKTSESMTGLPKSREHVEKHRLATTGRVRSPEAKKRIAEGKFRSGRYPNMQINSIN